MAEVNDPPINTETQLLAEHFGYPPVSLLDDIINSINILAEQALNSVEKGLLGVPPANLGFLPNKSKPSSSDPQNQPPSPEDAHRHEVENGTHQLETLLCASIDRNFDLFELWVMRNILTVRPDDRDWIRLSHYEGLDFSAAAIAAVQKKRRSGRRRKGAEESAPDSAEAVKSSAAEEKEGDEEEKEQEEEEMDGGGGDGAASDVPTVASVSRLRRRLQSSQKLNVMLHAERARNAALLAELRAVLHGTEGSAVKSEDGAAAAGAPTPPPPSLAFLRNKGDLAVGDASTPLTTTTAFTLSQLQALRALTTSLRTMLPDLRDKASALATPSSSSGPGDGSSSSATAQDGGARKSWRTERLEYVETSTRKHLERVRGLELGANGEVRDGEWRGPGRGLNPGEVDGLEKIVAAVGGGGREGGAGGGNTAGRTVDGDGDDAMD